jgi:hypothetical protein
MDTLIDILKFAFGSLFIIIPSVYFLSEFFRFSDWKRKPKSDINVTVQVDEENKIINVNF